MNLEELNAIKGANKDSKGIEIQRNLNKMTARERIAGLLDEGTFIEIGGLVNTNGGGVITGYGTVQGRLVYVFCQDYSVNGGALHKINSNKICNLMDMAVKMGAPIVQIFDSVGATVIEGIDILSSYASIIKRSAKNSGVIPVITLVAGPCTGSAAISAVMSDFTIVVKGTGELYISASEEITRNSNQFVATLDYGNVQTTSKNGTANIIADNDEEGNNYVRRLIELLPSNNLEIPGSATFDNISHYEEKLDSISVVEQYDINEVMNLLFDKDSILEINKNYGKSIVTALAKLNGVSVGVLACNKRINNGDLDKDSCEKAATFIRICDSFNVSIISLVDTKGFSRKLSEEENGLTKYAGKLVYALAGASVPKLSLIIGETYGAAFIALASKDSCFDFCYAWPGAKVSIGEPDGLINMLYREEILSSDNPGEKEKELSATHFEDITSIKKAAEAGVIDDIIAPGESSVRLFAVLDMLQSKRELNYPKKHGSVLI